MASTTATILTVKEINTSVENAAAFTRENGDLVNFALQHFGSHHELDLVIVVRLEASDAQIGAGIEIQFL